jgi:hypothetical protein
MTDGADDSDLITPAQPEQLEEADVVSLDAYSEDDDVVTEQVEAMLHEPRWLVQFTSLDRRLMDTSEVISALLGGTIRRDTLVWRGGMDDWLPVGRLDLLSPSAIPTLPPKGREASGAPSTSRGTSRAPAIRAKPLELTLAALAIALSTATITTSVLSIAGVFDTHSPTRVQALRAKPPAHESERTAGDGSRPRDVSPPPPDADRATAVVH